MIHVYYGNGKGKTTAALGLAVRAVGAGKRVVVVQFLKRRDSGEVAVLESIEGVTLLRGKACEKFSFDMNDEEKQQTAAIHNAHLEKAVDLVEQGNCDLLILDESLCALSAGLLDEQRIRSLIETRPESLELVFTGRKPPEYLLEAADYLTEMQCHKHPYDQNTPARKGVEF